MISEFFRSNIWEKISKIEIANWLKKGLRAHKKKLYTNEQADENDF